MAINKLNLPYIIIVTGFLFLLTFFSLIETNHQKRFVREREIPALGLAVSSKLEQRAWQYQKAGEALLKDNFILNWIETNNTDVDSLVFHMNTIRRKFEFDLIDASIVNDLTETYYDTNGEIIQLEPGNTDRDGWYYIYRETVKGTNLDSWVYTENDVFALYVNVPIISNNGTYLGVAGGGIDATQFMQNLNSFNTKHDINMYLIRQDGEIIYTQKKLKINQQKQNAKTHFGKSMFESILRNRTNAGEILVPDLKNTNDLFWSMYLEDWNTYLLIERKINSASIHFFKILFQILFSGGLIILGLCFFTAYYLKKILHKSIQKSEYYKNVSLKYMALHHSQGKLLRNAENSLLSLGKNAIETSVYIQECQSALKRYEKDSFVANTGSSIILEKTIKKLIESLSTEFSRKNIKVMTSTLEGETKVIANATILAHVIETLLLQEYDCEKKTRDIYITIEKYKGNPSIEFRGIKITTTTSDTNFHLQKSLLKEQNALLKVSGAKSENQSIHIIFYSDSEFE